MKKLILIVSSLIVGIFNINAQTSIEVLNSVGGVIAKDSIITETVPALGIDQVDVTIHNISGSTKTYGLTRTDLVLNAGANAYFCFGGQCFPNTTTTAPAAYYVTVVAGAQSSPAQLHYDENSTEGYSEIKYDIYDVNNVHDVSSLTLKINPLLSSVKTNNGLYSSISNVFPNPSNGKSQITVNSAIVTNNMSISITNALGTIVSTKTIELSIGKNVVILDSENLSSGIYFATISYDDIKTIKKFTINK